MKVSKLNFAAACALLLVIGECRLSAQGFKVYPGATRFTPPATEEALQAMPADARETIYLSSDSFGKVVAFYKGIAKQYTEPDVAKRAKLANGQQLGETFFIFDGAKDLTFSKNWAKVQRPYVGAIDLTGVTPKYHDIRDVTAIVHIVKSPSEWPEK